MTTLRISTHSLHLNSLNQVCLMLNHHLPCQMVGIWCRLYVARYFNWCAAYFAQKLKAVWALGPLVLMIQMAWVSLLIHSGLRYIVCANCIEVYVFFMLTYGLQADTITLLNCLVVWSKSHWASSMMPWFSGVYHWYVHRLGLAFVTTQESLSLSFICLFYQL